MAGQGLWREPEVPLAPVAPGCPRAAAVELSAEHGKAPFASAQ